MVKRAANFELRSVAVLLIQFFIGRNPVSPNLPGFTRKQKAKEGLVQAIVGGFQGSLNSTTAQNGGFAKTYSEWTKSCTT